MTESCRDRFIAELLAKFPVGSEWYDCVQDCIGIVEYVLPDHGGLLLRDRAVAMGSVSYENGAPVERDLTKNPLPPCYNRYYFQDLLDGRLIAVEPITDEHQPFYQYRERRDRLTMEFNEVFRGTEVWV